MMSKALRSMADSSEKRGIFFSSRIFSISRAGVKNRSAAIWL